MPSQWHGSRQGVRAWWPMPATTQRELVTEDALEDGQAWGRNPRTSLTCTAPAPRQPVPDPTEALNGSDPPHLQWCTHQWPPRQSQLHRSRRHHPSEARSVRQAAAPHRRGATAAPAGAGAGPEWSGARAAPPGGVEGAAAPDARPGHRRRMHRCSLLLPRACLSNMRAAGQLVGRRVAMVTSPRGHQGQHDPPQDGGYSPSVIR